MIPRKDWALLGLNVHPTGGSSRFGIPAPLAAAPTREVVELHVRRRGEPPHVLQIGLGCSLHWGQARRLVSEFRKARPDVDLSLSDVDDLEAETRILDRDLDAAIVIEGETPEGCRGAPLWSERLIAAVPEGHRLANGNAVDPAALRQEPILLAGDGRAHAGLQRAISRTLSGSLATFVCHPVERDTIFDLVALDFGVTVAPGATTGAFYPGVAFRPIASPTAGVRYALIWRPDNRNPALQPFAKLARSLAASPIREPAS